MMTFDRPFARLLLELCRYTYAAGFDDPLNARDKQDSLDWIKKAGGLTTPEPIILQGSTTSVACIAPYPDRNIVAYMGTKTQFDTLEHAIASIEDWSQNFEAHEVTFALSDEQLGADHPATIDKNDLGGRVHNGFLEELAAVQAQVIDRLRALGGRSRPVYLTGHSQGGAVAALATRALLAGGFPVVSTYTFAAPRPGNLQFKNSVPETLPIHRIEFGDDIVPHVPPALIGKGGIKLIAPEAMGVAKGLSGMPFLPPAAQSLLRSMQHGKGEIGFVGLGKLCYGSLKTRALHVDLTAEQESALFYDRLWSLVRHPEHWAEHHHLAGTPKEVAQGIKGNYTALVSDFQLVG